MKKQIFMGILAVTTALALAGCGGSTGVSAQNGSASGNAEKKAENGGSDHAAEGETIQLTFAGGNSSTEAYTYWVAVNKAVKSIHPELQITTVDATGGFDIAQRLRAGSIDAGNGVSTSDYESFAGTGSFEGQPYEDLRIMWYYTESPINFCVDKSLGLKYVHELDGVKMHPGGTGSANTLLVMNACDVLGIKPDWFEASSSDGIDAVMNRQIQGAARNGAAPDSQVVQMQSAVELSFLSLTDEEIEKIQEKYPYVLKAVIPAGSYEGQDEDFSTIATCQGGIATPSLTQEQGYKFISAMMSEEGRSSWEAAYPKGGKTDVMELTLKTARAPLHAGTVQYMAEQGIEVPENLIPSEYVPVK